MSDLVEAIRAACKELDPLNDKDWDSQGRPALARIRELADDKSITRADVNAANPDFGRDGAEENGKEELQGDDAAATEKETQEGTAGKAFAGSSGPTEPEVIKENASATAGERIDLEAISPAMNSQINDEDDGDGDGSDQRWEDEQELQIRGLIMAILLRLPPHLRASSSSTMLDRIMAFVVAWPTFSERFVVVEMIKSISETRRDEIASGKYEARIIEAMEIVTGQPLSGAISNAERADREAAAKRLAKAVGSQTKTSDLPERVQADISRQKALEGDDEQKAAAARLYGGGLAKAKTDR